jgi:hypothetical protein
VRPVVAVTAMAAILVQCEADRRSPAAELAPGVAGSGAAHRERTEIGVAAIGAAAIGAIIDPLITSSSSATSAFLTGAGGGGYIRMDIPATRMTTMVMATAATATIPIDTGMVITTIPVTAMATVDTAMVTDLVSCSCSADSLERATTTVLSME